MSSDETKPQFDFGFEPTVEAFVDPNEIVEVDASLLGLQQRVEHSIESELIQPQMVTLDLKERLRQARLNELGQVAHDIGNLEAGVKFQLANSTTQLMNDVESQGTAAGLLPVTTLPLPNIPIGEGPHINLPIFPGLPVQVGIPVPPHLIPNQPPQGVSPQQPGGNIPPKPADAPANAVAMCDQFDRFHAWLDPSTPGAQSLINYGAIRPCGVPGWKPGEPIPGQPGPVPGQPGTPPQPPVVAPKPPGSSPTPGPTQPPGEQPPPQQPQPGGPVPGEPTPPPPGVPRPPIGPPGMTDPPGTINGPNSPGYNPEEPTYYPPGYVPPPPPEPPQGPGGGVRPPQPPPTPQPPGGGGVTPPQPPPPQLPPPQQPPPVIPPLPPEPPPEEKEEEKPPIDKPMIPAAAELFPVGGCADAAIPQIGAGGDMLSGLTDMILGIISPAYGISSWTQFLSKNNFDLGKAAEGFIGTFGGFMNSLFMPVAQAAKCASPQFTGTMMARFLMGFASRWLGDGLDQLRRPTEYQGNFLCPTVLPTTAEATSAFLGDTITQERLECWARSNGNLFPEWWRVVRAARTKLTPLDLIGLLRREKIDATEYAKRVRENGYLDSEADELKTLAEPIPGIQDLIRFMLRDVDDPNVVDRFKLDDEFESKYQGKTKEWAEWQGMTPDIAKRYWRAHWEIPSPTQLFHMLHRLTRLPDGDPAKVTTEDIRVALQQQDIAPFWIDKFLAISYNPLTRVDVRRAFDIGVLKRDDVKKSYQDLGYAETQAETLAKFTEQLKIKRAVKLPISKSYINALIGVDEWKAGLTLEGYTSEEIDQVRPFIEQEITQSTRKVCIPAIRHKYLTGEINKSTAVSQVMGMTSDARQASEVVERWTCERESRSKSIPVSKISGLFRDGLLTVVEVHTRLTNLGYSAADASRLVQQMELAAARESDRKADAEMKKRIREEEKARKQAESEAAKTEQKIEKAKSLAEKRRKESDSHRESILTTARTLSDLWETSLPDENNWLTNLKNQVVRETAERPDFVVAVLGTVAKSQAAESREMYVSQVGEIVRAGLESFQQSMEETASGSSNVSGETSP